MSSSTLGDGDDAEEAAGFGGCCMRVDDAQNVPKEEAMCLNEVRGER